MRQLQTNNANYTNVFLETIQNILTPILTSKESVLKVEIVSFVQVGAGSNLFLQVVFKIFLKEFCSPGLCPTDKTSTTLLDDKVIARITETLVDGSFTKELKAETAEAIEAGEINATDVNAVTLTKLNETATATVTFTTIAFVTTPAPTNVPSKKPSSSPSSNPSSYPSLSTNPSSDPSTNPSSDPSTDPSTNPSSDPSTDPSTNPSSFPSTDPSTNPSENPTFVKLASCPACPVTDVKCNLAGSPCTCVTIGTPCPV
jgi:hypothetical protein